MLFLNKLLPVFVLPVGVVAIVVVLAALRRWRAAGVLAGLGLVVLSLPVCGNALLGRLESIHPPLRVAEVPPADAVLVLGGVMAPARAPGLLPEWADSVERFEAGVALLRADRARLLLFTGDPRGSEGATLRRLAIARGVPEERIAVIGEVGNTADEAAQLRRHAAAHGLRRVVLVTSAWHLPRAVRQFRGAGVELVPFPVDYRSMPNRLLPYMDWLPTANALEKTELALRECYGLAFYSVFGR